MEKLSDKYINNSVNLWTGEITFGEIAELENMKIEELKFFIAQLKYIRELKNVNQKNEYLIELITTIGLIIRNKEREKERKI